VLRKEGTSMNREGFSDVHKENFAQANQPFKVVKHKVE
jgi:hypothetical protein